MTPADRVLWAIGALSLIVSGIAALAAIGALLADWLERRNSGHVLPPPVRDVHRTSSSLIDVDFKHRRRVS